MEKILISAYACEPNKGSEPEVGWQWVCHLAKYYEVWVLTKANNQKTIEDYIKKNNLNLENVHFIYVNLSKKLTFWKKGNRGMRLYYYLWQKKALSIAKKYHQKHHFKLVHSITFVSYTQPCFLYKLNIPLFWTVAGGENISTEIGYPMTFIERVYEMIRKIGQKKAIYSFSTMNMLKKSSRIFAATHETLEKLPKKYRDKVIVTSAIGIESKKEAKKEYGSPIKVLLSGKYIYLKGMDIGIKAILKVLEQVDNVHFDILGNGKYFDKCKKLCGNNISSKITFIDRIEHNKMYDFYKEHDILLNTALRDSGCLVVMEAMSVGLPVVCIDTGGVKEMTTEQTAIKVTPCKYEELVDRLSDGLLELINDKDKRVQYGQNAYKRINEMYLYDIKVKKMADVYQEYIGE